MFAPPSKTIVYQESISFGTCLSSRCLAMDVSSNSTVLALSKYATILKWILGDRMEWYRLY
jgi:hypothetical protein